ncbi:MAG TPA: ATP synthase F1 subunit epsilon [Bacteroidales bacterium]|mgnify:FL=1|nr:ATP synthase F1 subunit epsilon [Bacteroidales bacterium]HPS46340.1 ATP synthase F1 subunit epsilon [Bacteroidales bacterium]HQH18421.1 ATP synthase F1 subunit epsilon [Bacteroidales bacterium]
MYIEIITPDKKIFSGEVSLAQFPGTDGLFEILNNHAPIVSTLTKGKIKVIDAEKQTRYFEIKSGVVEMQKNKIIVLAE